MQTHTKVHQSWRHMDNHELQGRRRPRYVASTSSRRCPEHAVRPRLAHQLVFAWEGFHRITDVEEECSGFVTNVKGYR